MILQGPHLFVGTPLYKLPNSTMRHNQDWQAVDLERLAPETIPITSYKPAGDRHEYDRTYTQWGDEERQPARDFYRVAWRKMAANTGERTLIPAIIPPGATHIDGIFSAGYLADDNKELVLLQASLGSLVGDFLTRAVPKGDIRAASVKRLPRVVIGRSAVESQLLLRTLRLNCVTSAYAELWRGCYSQSFQSDTWAGGFCHGRRTPLSDVRPKWDGTTPLRIAVDRRQALLEIDALIALEFGLTADELCTIYRTQFAVLYGYDRNVYYYDVNGRLVPNSVLSVWRKKGDRITEDERTATNQAGNTYTYEPPFVTLDREKDIRQAHAHFEGLLKERS